MKTGTKEYYAEYYRDNKEKHKARMQDYRQDNEKIQLYEAEYHKQKYQKIKTETDINVLREKWNQQSKIKNKQRREFINEYKSKCSCSKCGEIRPYILDFHHIDPSQKSFDLGDATKHSIEKLKLELEKCITLCRNCHSEFHYFEKEQSITISEYLLKK
jgi:Zn finger protein HypA/HybF involved in hydrogenase expression